MERFNFIAALNLLAALVCGVVAVMMVARHQYGFAALNLALCAANVALLTSRLKRG